MASRGRNKVIHTFPEGICWKVNMITLLEFELAYYDVIDQHVSQYVTGTTPLQENAIKYALVLYNEHDNIKNHLIKTLKR